MLGFKNRLNFLFQLLFISILGVFACFPAFAQKDGMVIIRDTEIENTIKDWSLPIFQAANLDPKSINVVLVQSNELNAFVAGGSNIFIYTGLIEATKNPGELLGVIAHETGHIAGGHLIRSREAMERASYESIIGTLLGVGAAVVTGDTGAAPALSVGSNSMVYRRLLAHSRIQESSADQAALTFLDKAKISPAGLQSFMERLKAEMYMPTDQQSEYVMTHPLVENRMEALETRINASAYKDQAYPSAWNEQHARMKAKLLGFINPERVPWVYTDQDVSLPALYARAIAAYRKNRIEEALGQIDGLISQEPKNAYFLELKAQMLAEFGRGKEAIPVYRQALYLLPGAPLLRVALAHALIESADAGEQNLREAINELERAAQEEPRMSNIHRLLATAYGRLGDESMAQVHLAEEAVQKHDYDYAKSRAENVLHITSAEGGKAALKAKDIISFIEGTERQ